MPNKRIPLAGERANPERQSWEDGRESRRGAWIESTLQDIRFALRTLRKSPGFTATSILILGLGIGANTAIFQLVDAVRLRSLPVADPAALVSVQIKGGNRGLGISSGETSLTSPIWEQIRREQQSFSGVFAWGDFRFYVGQGIQGRTLPGLWVSGDIFRTLGVIPFKGRLFRAEDDIAGCGTPGVVISYAFWQSEFAGMDSAIGKSLVVGERPIEVIGVTPPNFFGLKVGNTFDVALPLCSLTALDPKNASRTRRDYFWLNVMGRLKPGWTLAQANAQLAALSPALMEATVPTEYSGSDVEQYRNFELAAYRARTGVSELRTTYDTSLWLLLGITGLVLLIACANLANLLLARASTREREMAIRQALGATRWRIIRQLLSEGLALAVIGAGVGLAVASVFSRTLVWFLGRSGTLLSLDLSLDWRVLGFTMIVALSTCVVFGLAPAFRLSRADPGTFLKTGTRGTVERQGFSFQRMLVVSQMAFSVALLAGGLLFVRSFWNLMTTDPGFRQSDIVIAYVYFGRLNIAAERYENFKLDLLNLIRAIPQVESAATTIRVPLDSWYWNLNVRIGSEEDSSKFTWVSPGYFATLQIPLLAGRDFSDRDAAQSPPVVIVNEKFVQRFFGGVNPLGKTIRTVAEPNFPESQCEIIGVVKNTKYTSLRDETPPMSFAPALQFPDKWYWTFLIIRSSSPPDGIIAAVREKLFQLNPHIYMEFSILQTRIENGLLRERMMALLSGFFGGLAALLTMVGLYGVISYIVATRRNEIGIRRALGASRLTVVRMILRQTLGLLAIGGALGILLSLVATRGAGSLLFGVGPDDPLTLVGASMLLLALALMASLVPAHRASRLEPMNALRHE